MDNLEESLKMGLAKVELACWDIVDSATVSSYLELDNEERKQYIISLNIVTHIHDHTKIPDDS